MLLCIFPLQVRADRLVVKLMKSFPAVAQTWPVEGTLLPPKFEIRPCCEWLVACGCDGPPGYLMNMIFNKQHLHLSDAEALLKNAEQKLSEQLARLERVHTTCA